MKMRNASDTFPCGRNVNAWESCKDCPDYPCKEHWKNVKIMSEEKTIVDILVENNIHPIDLLEDLALTLDGPPLFLYDSMRSLADLLEKNGVKVPPRGYRGQKVYPKSAEDYIKWRNSQNE